MPDEQHADPFGELAGLPPPPGLEKKIIEQLGRKRRRPVDPKGQKQRQPGTLSHPGWRRVAIAAAILAAVGLVTYAGAAQHESKESRRKAEESRQEAEESRRKAEESRQEAKRHLRKLEAIGYLKPVQYQGVSDEGGRKIVFLVAGKNQIYVGGTVHPETVERVTVLWGDPDQGGQDAEVLYERNAARPLPESGRVPFSGSHSYRLRGQMVTPRLKVELRQDHKEDVERLNPGDLHPEANFRCSPWGIVIPSGALDPERLVAERVLAIGGAVKLHPPFGAKDKIVRVEDLPPTKFSIQIVWLGSHRGVGDDDLRSLKDLGSLQGIYADSTNVSDVGLLSEIPTLVWLHLKHTRVSDDDDGFKAIAKLRQLETLQLDNTRLSDAGLTHLRALTSLRWLTLSGTAGVSDRGLKHLEGLRNLHHLDLRKTEVSEEGVKKLRQALPGCRIVIRPPSPEEEVAKWVLEKGGKLKVTRTNIIDEKPVSEDAACERERDLPDGDFYIKGVYFWRADHVSDADLSGLSGIRQLRGLALVDARVTDAGLELISKRFKDLKWMYLDGVRMTDAGLAHVGVLRKLEVLSLAGTPTTDAGLKHLKGLTSLDELVLTGTQVTEAGMRELQTALPRCKVRR